ncbi:hypothetical protein BKK51_03535 [Rodentibacter trehalosifermentans]|uniref:Glycosyl transferase family 1 domain-containing protein n=1 Tax=Rodentibacter trehalosifermentans TaxID=1908263 RepID=A0A1V3IW20_9PAST|nr:hypothetical protein BKK51_03535 [Rodentibacter trehalosifermentans]
MNQSINHIYYIFTYFHARGGDYVNLAHIRALNKLGFNASILFLGRDYNTFAKAMAAFPDIPITRFDLFLTFHPTDRFISTECYRFMFDGTINFPKENIILHNQLPSATYEIFDSIHQLNEHPFQHIIVPSDYAKNTLLEIGVNKSIKTIYPAIPEFFYPQEKSQKTIKLTYSSRKRGEDFQTLLFYLRSLYTNNTPLTIVNLDNMSREAVAKEMQDAAIYLSMAHQESLGLMALEAMACGCHVVGFTGYPDNARQSLLKDENGDWVNEGDYYTFAKKVCEAVELFKSGARNPKVKNGLHLIETQFRQAHFEQALLQFYNGLS